jgi:Kef-type K+ transport system membrane component KefB
VDSSTIASLAVIATVAALAPVLAQLLARLRIPSVVIEIGLGIVVGPALLGWATVDPFIDGFADLGLTFLMFLAGYEIELSRIKGRPLRNAGIGWFISLGLGFAVALPLVEASVVRSDLIVGLALTTTALGTLLPILRDAGDADTPFGTQVLAIGTAGEFLPVVAVALLLTSDKPLVTAGLLVVFVVVAVAAALLAAREHSPRVVTMLRANLHTSAQLPVRFSVVLIVVLVWIASELGLDVLLGAFAAGVVVRLFSHDAEAETVKVKLEAIGFGFLIPIFFVVSGMRFDLDALLDDPATLLRLPLFLAMFLVVRGIPALLLYRKDVAAHDRLPLALYSGTALPLVVVITTIGVDTDRMVPANAAALVGAGMLSVLLYPQLAGALRRRHAARVPVTAEAQDLVDEPDATGEAL